MDIRRYLQDQKLRVDRFLESLFQGEEIPPKLREAVRYSLLAGGKRIRPILTLAACEACGWGEEGRELALPVGVTLEMIHTYSLIHDDLPAMDNDDLRRGQPTNHKKFGEATAILAGDTLLTEAFSLLSSLKTKAPSRLLQAIHEIAHASGGEGMAGGQVLDLESEGKKIGAEELERIHRMKTGCLLRASVVVGGLVANAPEERLQALGSYGVAIGLSFQIADDILNVEGSTENLGKAAGSDAVHGKATYPSIVGLEASRRLAEACKAKGIESLQGFGASADPLREIAAYIVERKT